ncbi:MAG: DNA methyltransferase [Candidatus Binataceae bacterium]
MGAVERRQRGLTLPFNNVERLCSDKSAVLECQDNLAFMRSLPDASIKLIVTSPPYNIGKAYERRSTLEQYIQEQSAVIAECVRLLHPRGSICWQVGGLHPENSAEMR